MPRVHGTPGEVELGTLLRRRCSDFVIDERVFSSGSQNETSPPRFIATGLELKVDECVVSSRSAAVESPRVSARQRNIRMAASWSVPIAMAWPTRRAWRIGGLTRASDARFFLWSARRRTCLRSRRARRSVWTPACVRAKLAPASLLIPVVCMSHPCLHCGACCAIFRVAFHWSETDAFPGGSVPQELTTAVDPHRVAMRGTEGCSPHCAALRGNVGESVSCAIYDRRPSPCRDLHPAGSNGEPSPQCDRARLAYGMAPLGAG